MAAAWNQFSQDPDAYRLIAENLLDHGVFSRSPQGGPVEPTAFRPPLYPLLLVATAWHGRVTEWSVAALHLVLGIVTVLWTLWLARRWSLGSGAWLAALLVAIDPILLNQSAQVMTETLATCLAVGGLLAMTHALDKPEWWSTLLAGMIIGLAALCRPTFLIWAALIFLYSLCRFAMVVGTAPLGDICSWRARGTFALDDAESNGFGRPIFATTHGGYTLLLGNNPYVLRASAQRPLGQRVGRPSSCCRW